MKMAALIIGLLGSLAVLGLGAKWVSDFNKFEKTIAAIEKLSEQLGKSNKISASMAKVKRLKTAGYLMIILGIAALIGSILVLKMSKVSAIIMLAAAIIPGVLAPQSLVAGFLLIIAGILAFIAKPKAA